MTISDSSPLPIAAWSSIPSVTGDVAWQTSPDESLYVSQVPPTDGSSAASGSAPDVFAQVAWDSSAHESLYIAQGVLSGENSAASASMETCNPSSFGITTHVSSFGKTRSSYDQSQSLIACSRLATVAIVSTPDGLPEMQDLECANVALGSSGLQAWEVVQFTEPGGKDIGQSLLTLHSPKRRSNYDLVDDASAVPPSSQARHLSRTQDGTTFINDDDGSTRVPECNRQNLTWQSGVNFGKILSVILRRLLASDRERGSICTAPSTLASSVSYDVAVSTSAMDGCPAIQSAHQQPGAC